MRRARLKPAHPCNGNYWDEENPCAGNRGITTCGAGAGIPDAVGEFGKGRVITTDINPLSPALYFGHRHHIGPLTTDRYYIPIIESICDEENASLVIPTIDDELPTFGKARERLASVGVRVAISGEADRTDL